MPYGIPIVEKTFRVLDAVAAGASAGSMQQLARSLNIAPSSCFRILRTLQQQGWIAERPGGGWELSVSLIRLLDGLRPVQSLIEQGRRPLDQLALGTHLAAKMSVRQGDNAVTVLRGESPAAMAVTGRVGSAYPLAIGSSGAALCADLSAGELDELIARAPASAWKHQTQADFRRRVALGQAGRTIVDRGSFQPTIHAASIPLRDSAGAVLGAITLIALAGDLPDSRLPAVTRALHDAAAAITGQGKSKARRPA